MKNKKLLLLIFGLLMTAQMIYSQDPSYVPTNGLVGYWPFNGNANDQSGNGLNGTVNGASLTTDRFENVNSAYNYDGGDVITIPHNSSLNTYPITVSVWIKTNQNFISGENGFIVSKYINSSWNGWNVNLQINNSSSATIIPAYLRSSNPCNGVIEGYSICNNPVGMNYTGSVNNTNWRHIVFVVDSNGGKLYLDGQLVSSQIWIGNPGSCTTTTPLLVGKNFKGKIDDVGIWNRALTSSEIQLLYTGCSTPAPTGNASQTLCSGSTIANLTATGTNIQWYSTTTAGTAIASTTALENGTTYYASQTVNGCESTARLSVVVSLNTAAGISLTSGPSNQYIIEGCQIQEIIYTLSGGATGVTTTGLPFWVDVTTVGNTVTINSSLALSQVGYYDYTITTTGGCGTSSVFGSIGVMPGPSLVLSSPIGTDNQSVCLGASIQNISYNSWQGSGNSYVANLPLGVKYYNNGFELIITGTPIESGVYYYTVYNFGQCQSYGILGTIIVNSTPAPTGANNQTMTQGSTIANLVVAGQNIVWYSNPFEGTTLTLNTPLVNGTTYYASQTINGCESQDRLPVTVQFTLNNNEFDSINIVYNPNPVIDILYIKASTELKNAKICNVLGQTIFQQRFNSNEIQLNMSDFSTGTYFVIVESDDRKETFKILKK